MGENGASAERERVVGELRQADKLVVVTHENPDGDALGSLIAMQGLLTALGKDVSIGISDTSGGRGVITAATSAREPTATGR